MFEDYAKTVGINQPQFNQPGILQYLMMNDKAKQNLKSLLPLPLTIKLDSSMAELCRFFPRSYVYLKQLNSMLGVAFQCLSDNKLPNGMRFSKFYLECEREKTWHVSYRIDAYHGPMCEELGISDEATPQEIIKALRERVASYKISKCIVSTELNDILDASTNCSWSSCFNPIGVYKEAPFKLALDTITAIATFYNDEDKKLGRCWVHIDHNGERLILGRNYGNIAHSCITQVANSLWSMLGNESKFDGNNSSWRKKRHYTYIDTPTVNWQHKSQPYKGKKFTFKTGSEIIYCLHCGSEIVGGGLLCNECSSKTAGCRACGKRSSLDSNTNSVAMYLFYNNCDTHLCKSCVEEAYESCPHCNKLVDTRALRMGMCPSCYDKMHIKCEWCGEIHVVGTECNCTKLTCTVCNKTKHKIFFVDTTTCTMCYLEEM